LKPLSHLAGLALLLPLSSCAVLPLPSAWTAKPLVLAGNDRDWDRLPPVRLQDVELKACNDGQSLTLRLSSMAEHVKHQWMGVYGQSLLLLFDPSGRAPLAQGLRLTLTPPTGAQPPWDPKREPEYVWSSADKVELVQRADGGGYLPRPIRPSDAEWEMHFQGQTLVYQVRVPLRQERGWDLGLAPGQTLGLRVRTTAIDPHVAMAMRPAFDSRVPSTAFRNTSVALTNVAATGDSPTAADGSYIDPSGSSGSVHQNLTLGSAPGAAQKRLADYPAPVNVPDPLDLDLSLRLAPAP